MAINPVKQGEAVSLGYNGSTQAAVIPINIFDGNGVLRVLQSNERLILDMMQGTFATSTSTTFAWIIGSIATPSSTAPPSTGVLVAFDPLAGLPAQGTVFPGEGYSLPRTATVWGLMIGDGWQSTWVEIAGTGRIIQDGGWTATPPWVAPFGPLQHS